MKGNSLIIIPTYNESENIELIINKILVNTKLKAIFVLNYTNIQYFVIMIKVKALVLMNK